MCITIVQLTGLNHTASIGVISSPGWPNLYIPKQNCLDIISAPGKTITVTFQTFHLEDNTCGEGCDVLTGSYKIVHLK